MKILLKHNFSSLKIVITLKVDLEEKKLPDLLIKSYYNDKKVKVYDILS